MFHPAEFRIYRPRTVDTYLRRIFAKLNVTSRAAMVARLSEEGLLNDRPGNER
jgi:DNA-binding CsgD family transcriptional regulator